MKYLRLALIWLFFCFFLNSSAQTTEEEEGGRVRTAVTTRSSSCCCCCCRRLHRPTADLILLSLTVALLLPGPRRPCSLWTCRRTPCRLVLTSCITEAEPGVDFFFCFCPLLTSGRENASPGNFMTSSSNLHHELLTGAPLHLQASSDQRRRHADREVEVLTGDGGYAQTVLLGSGAATCAINIRGAVHR
ncbi:hypothetical protein EYF80_055983 [Liparis tanakae]|uniref:Secreted protein n=1 Tax=Liparis tanakae TaxID=230148 RepID=A0A4Z2EYK2_9TELE|nr:hypothetical protein EYF80_055983 [Liparis tanakae]